MGRHVQLTCKTRVFSPLVRGWRRRQGHNRRSSNVLANPPFLRNAHLEIGTSAGAIAVRIESHLVSSSALVGHDELWEVAFYMQALRFHFFHCPGPSGCPPSTEGWTTPGMQSCGFGVWIAKDIVDFPFMDWWPGITERGEPAQPSPRTNLLVEVRS